MKLIVKSAAMTALFAALILSGGCAFNTGRQSMSDSPTLEEQAWMKFEKGGVAGAIEFLNAHPDPLAATLAADELSRRIYNDKKDVPAAVEIWQAAIRRAMIEAELAGKSDADRAYELRSSAKTCTYNLAANTWPGWGDEGIVIGPDERNLGLRAAQANLRLADDPDKGALPLSRAWWMLGAHLIVDGRWSAARDAFQRAAEHAAEAGVESERWLAIGFERLVDVLEDPDSPDRLAGLKEAKEHLAPLPDGEFFISQIDTAYRIFSEY